MPLKLLRNHTSRFGNRNNPLFISRRTMYLQFCITQMISISGDHKQLETWLILLLKPEVSAIDIWSVSDAVLLTESESFFVQPANIMIRYHSKMHQIVSALYYTTLTILSIHLISAYSKKQWTCMTGFNRAINVTDVQQTAYSYTGTLSTCAQVSSLSAQTNQEWIQRPYLHLFKCPFF